jgi:hypothetical protein
MRNAYKILMGKPLRKWPLGRANRQMYNIKMDLREVGCKGDLE